MNAFALVTGGARLSPLVMEKRANRWQQDENMRPALNAAGARLVTFIDWIGLEETVCDAPGTRCAH